MTTEDLTDRIVNAFSHLYPPNDDGDSPIEVIFNDDETIDVMIADGLTFRAEPESDNDEYLRFGLYDPDYAEEHPDEPIDGFLQIRIRVL